MGSEQFIIRTIGGPHPGNRFVSSGEYAWPLPDVLTGTQGGSYHKVSESQLAEGFEYILRGAAYEWRATDG